MTAEKILEDMGDLYTRADQYDFSKLSNYIPLDRTLLRPEHTYQNAPAVRYSVFGAHGGLSNDGCGLGSGTMEFERVMMDVPVPAYHALQDLFSWLPLWRQYKDKFYLKQLQAALRILKKHNLEIPAVRFMVIGSPWPGDESPAVVYHNTFHPL